MNAGQSQVSTDGGSQPLWSSTGRELFFVASDGVLMAVRVTAHQDRWNAGLPMPVVQAAAYERRGASYFGRTYDVSADGKQFLITKPTSPDASGTPQIVVVTHWDEELTRLVPR